MILAAIFFVVTNFQSNGQSDSLPAIQLQEGHASYEAGKFMEILEDRTHTLTFEDVSSGKYDSAFKQSTVDAPNYGYSTSTFWMKFSVINTSSDKQVRWLVQPGNILLGHAKLFTINSLGDVERKEVDMNTPIAERQIKERALLFDLNVQPGEVKTVYMQIGRGENKLLKVTIWNKDDYVSAIRLTDVLISIFVGILLTLIIYNLFLFFSVFDISYIFYFVFIATFGLSTLSISGYGFQYMGGSKYFNGDTFIIYSFLASIFGTLFNWSYLNIKSFYPRLHKITLGYVLILIALLTFLLYGPGRYFLPVLGFASQLVIVSIVVMYIAGVLIMRKGYKPARYYVVGRSLLSVAFIIMMLMFLGYLPANTVTMYGVRFAALLEILILSLGLGDKLRTVTIDLKVKTLESKRLAESEKMKSDFFSNVSHEFRTPLSLIISPLERILKSDAKDLFHAQHQLMHRNARRLLQLVNQLLYLTKLDNKSTRLRIRNEDMVKEVRLIAAYFESLAAEKGINFNQQLPENEMIVPFDQEKLEIILFNLLSNAFKFTPAGEVSLLLRKSSGSIDLVVEDSGIGIPSDQLEKIFDRFYQVNSTAVREYEGTGIGLSLVQELVRLHKGKLTVTSELNKGSIFTISLPDTVHAYRKEDFLQRVSEKTDSYGYPFSVDNPINAPETITAREGAIILIIEDNADFRAFTKSVLSEKYQVLEATNGLEGWSMAQEKIPDLIVADMMMPKLDGLELCSRVKADVKTNHIPIILLTARQAVDYQIKGFETGADDYITKPFNADVLLIRIHNLIDQRNKLRDKFSKEGLVHYQQRKTMSVDERFMLGVRTILDAHHANPRFSIEDFASATNMSRTQLHRKLVALTGQPASDVLRNYRLDKAMDLLRQKAGNVSDIAYQTGFENLSYFSKIFREKFGQSPSEV